MNFIKLLYVTEKKPGPPNLFKVYLCACAHVRLRWLDKFPAIWNLDLILPCVLTNMLEKLLYGQQE